MVILDTSINADTDSSTLAAFLYGQLKGTYRLYTELGSKKLSIRFEDDEDATVFKLKSLDEIYNDQFDSSINARDARMRNIFDNISYKSANGPPTATEWLSSSKNAYNKEI